MAEFCLKCYNKMFDSDFTEKQVVLSDDFLCEECGQWLPCVCKIKRKYDPVKISRSAGFMHRLFGNTDKTDKLLADMFKDKEEENNSFQTRG